jgi:hypothetical protein
LDQGKEKQGQDKSIGQSGPTDPIAFFFSDTPYIKNKSCDITYISTLYLIIIKAKEFLLVFGDSTFHQNYKNYHR